MFLRWTRTDKWLYAAEVSGKMINEELTLTFNFGPNDNPKNGGNEKVIVLNGSQAVDVTLVQESVSVYLSVSWLNPPTAKNMKEAFSKMAEMIQSGYTPLININGSIVEPNVANVAVDTLLLVKDS
jgi:hypothetical protein